MQSSPLRLLDNSFADWVRRGEIFITALVLIATPIGAACTHSWQALAAVRVVMGVGIGAKGAVRQESTNWLMFAAATVPMYAAEVSPAVIRGALTMGWQLWTAFGETGRP